MKTREATRAEFEVCANPVPEHFIGEHGLPHLSALFHMFDDTYTTDLPRRQFLTESARRARILGKIAWTACSNDSNELVTLLAEGHDSVARERANPVCAASPTSALSTAEEFHP